jgi:arginine decarboxylase
MKIYLVAGIGEGKTEISAFDKALHDIGIANHNLIPLSSVIPPDTTIIRPDRLNLNNEGFGDRLYCVMSRHITTVIGESACAGIGWVC